MCFSEEDLHKEPGFWLNESKSDLIRHVFLPLRTLQNTFYYQVIFWLLSSYILRLSFLNQVSSSWILMQQLVLFFRDSHSFLDN